MLKKAGLLTVGVTAGLLAVAPIASAGEASVKGEHNDKDNSRSEDHGKKWDKDKDDHGKKHHKAKQSCDSNGGDAEARGAIEDSDAGLAGNALTQAPIGGASVGSILSCNSDVLNGNLSNNTLDLL